MSARPVLLPPDPPRVDPVDRLAQAVQQLALATRQQTALLEVLVESMPATAEAKLLGICEKTVRKRREQRRAERQLGAR